jgi:hypothetical protein
MVKSRKRAVKFAAIILGLIVALFFAGDVIAWCFPKYNFRSVTGRSLPHEVRIVKFESKLCDNLFRSCYYWKLEHPPQGHWAIMRGADFRSGFDNEEGYRDDVLAVLEPTASSNAIGPSFKLSIEYGSQFLFVHTNGTNSYYYKGTL